MINARRMPIEPTPAQLADVDLAKRVTFISDEWTWTLSTDWLRRISAREPSFGIGQLLQLGRLTYLWSTGDEVVFADHAGEDANVMFAELAPSRFHECEGADAPSTCFIERYFGVA